MGFRAQGSGFWGLGLGVQGSGFRVWGFRGSGLGVQGSGFGVRGFGV